MPMKLHGESRVEATSEQVSAELSDEAVILNMADGIYYGLNDVGARVWELLKSPRTINSIVESLLEEFEAEAGQCRKDVFRLLEEMQSRGLVIVQSE